jgi:hypothetical protein
MLAASQRRLLAILLAGLFASLERKRLVLNVRLRRHVGPTFHPLHEIAAGDFLANLKVDS